MCVCVCVRERVPLVVSSRKLEIPAESAASPRLCIVASEHVYRMTAVILFSCHLILYSLAA